MRRRWLWPAGLLAVTAGYALLGFFVYQWVRIEVPPRLGPAARAAAMAPLRAVVDGESPGEPSHPELDRPLANRGPVVAMVFVDGRQRTRVLGHGRRYADAVHAAARALAGDRRLENLSPDERRRARIQVSIVVGRGPLLQKPALASALGLHPGLDGVGVTLDGEKEVLLLPQDLISRRLLTSSTPLSFIPDLKIGFDFERADMALAVLARRPPGGYGEATRDYWRFRTDSFVEPPPGEERPPLRLTRVQPPGPELDEHSLRRAALAGGRYLVEHMAPTGRYVYEVDLATGRATNPEIPTPYSLPRHAGTTYFLAELYRHTGEEFLREPIERAFGHLRQLVEQGGCSGEREDVGRFACVVDRGRTVTSLGSTALTVVALAEYKRATGGDEYDQLAAELTAWILTMQRDDGSFAHRYDVRRGERDDEAELLYFSGEAALALARMYDVYGDPRYRDAAERALDWLVEWYDFFAGGFFYGEEHWTCIAAEALYPAVAKETYLDFCRGYGAFLRRQQLRVGDFPSQNDLAGTYGFTPFIAPQNTPAGSRTEAMISAYQLSLHHGRPDAAIREQVLRAMQYALGQQVRPDNDWWIPALTRPHGAIPGSPISRVVRIDYVQHVCSAMIRTADLLRDEANR